MARIAWLLYSFLCYQTIRRRRQPPTTSSLCPPNPLWKAAYSRCLLTTCYCLFVTGVPFFVETRDSRKGELNPISPLLFLTSAWIYWNSSNLFLLLTNLPFKRERLHYSLGWSVRLLVCCPCVAYLFCSFCDGHLKERQTLNWLSSHLISLIQSLSPSQCASSTSRWDFVSFSFSIIFRRHYSSCSLSFPPNLFSLLNIHARQEEGCPSWRERYFSFHFGWFLLPLLTSRLKYFFFPLDLFFFKHFARGDHFWWGWEEKNEEMEASLILPVPSSLTGRALKEKSTKTSNTDEKFK